MGYAKYHEDDIKISDDRFFLRNGSGFTDHTDNCVIEYYECKYCHKVFESRKSIFFHIKEHHNIVRPLVVINGKIAGDSCVISYLRSAYIDLFGFDCPIEINGYKLTKDHADEIDITDLLACEIVSKSRCLISFHSSKVEVSYVPISSIKNAAVASIIEHWENDINTRKRLIKPNYDELDEGTHRFLNGVYNYYIATQATKDKSKRYDDAFAILSGFNDLDGIGNCILKIIAFRRNWIARLEMLTTKDKDIFSVASDYYHRRPSVSTKFLSEKQVYIEDQINMSLDLVLLYQQNQIDLIERKLSEIPDIEMLDDRLLIDRLNLLKARLAVMNNDRKRAELYYDRTIEPAFRDEYEQYQKGILQLK